MGMQKLSEFTDAIADYTSLVNAVIARQENISEPHKFINAISIKTNNSLDAVNFLLKQSSNNPHFSDSIFLILRTILSDAITYYYLLYKSASDNSFLSNIKWLESQHVYYTENNLPIFQVGYKEDRGVIDTMKEDWRNHHKEYYDSAGEPIYPRMTGIRGMIKEIANSNKILNHYAIRAYGLYDIFSKYEHLGLFTQELIYRHSDETNSRQIQGEIYESIVAILCLQKSLLNGSFKNQSEQNTFENLSAKVEAIKLYERS